jgi:Na+/melibiose symporter-like transporter
MPLFVVIKSTYEIEFAFYVGFGIIFSIGWAAIQISHMSLVPSLTLDRKRRVKSK